MLIKYLSCISNKLGLSSRIASDKYEDKRIIIKSKNKIAIILENLGSKKILNIMFLSI